MHLSPICIFGEVLFDRFPDGHRVLGGAPFNVAWHLHAFGASVRLISAVGDDPDGAAVRAAMRDWGMNVADLQTDPDHATGEVTVSLTDGEPAYDIVPDRAYDSIRSLAAGAGCGLLYHGTLALRQPVSAATLQALKAEGPDRVFLDVNLRAPWWSRDATLGLVTDADWVKLNRDELAWLEDSGPTSPDLATRARAFLERHDLAGLIVTLGGDGALGLTADGTTAQVAPAPATEVVDTVGAGDAFAAVLILGILDGWPLATTLERAQSFASRIVGQRGATRADAGLYVPFIGQWGL
ncbi:PfkB family carbohydrate kinase [Thiocystis violascens]|uniref:Sugar kinase, ribokinase n=1 Tax=Thiocystis violascens (strain ATCC 17096 / DSM 198 / 6111) TaxID=765911 RepID=I3Y868_THIV6|nr:PfkB family carbohydrate kinase [Thiocystis violascens]AFL73186.1 sugar kinase, ribokinase [Thiocystis violascens DSM 198]